MNNLSPIITRGVAFLSYNQQKSGSFISLSSKDPDIFSAPLTYDTTFTPSLILSCLNMLPSAKSIQKIQRKITDYLLTQKNQYWTFNYWDRNSHQASTMPYPDDLDDTFVATSALQQHNPALITPDVMAKIVTVLNSTEESVGGPYRTWIVARPHKEWSNVDLAVNSNVAYFLKFHNVHLLKIDNLIEKAIAENTFTSPYYPSYHPIVYFMSRAYEGNLRDKLVQYVLSQQHLDGSWGNPLQTALAVTTLLQAGALHETVKSGVEYLIKSEQQGSWPAYAFCIDPHIDGVIHYAGSPALTTAFCLEALALYQRSQGESIKPSRIRRTDADIMHQKVVRHFFIHTKTNSSLDRYLKTAALKTIHYDPHHQITLLPYWTKRALGAKGQHVADSTVIQLGTASVAGWLAYNIYDDFLDQEAEPHLLPIANICLRELTVIFTEFGISHSSFLLVFREIMNAIEKSNANEVLHHRIIIKDGMISRTQLQKHRTLTSDTLADRSLGHALSSIAILYASDIELNQDTTDKVLLFFRHYLCARQIHDDMHDWADDLQKGNITYVIEQLMCDAEDIFRELETQLKVEKIIPSLQQHFWEQTVISLNNEVKEHLKKAHTSLLESHLFAQPHYLSQLITSLEESTNDTLNKQQQALQFIKAYSTHD